MKTLWKNQWNIASVRVAKHILRPVFWALAGALIVLAIGCSSTANEQATAERMTVVAADQVAAATREIEMEVATNEAMKMAMATTDAATVEAEEALAAQATADAEADANAQATADAEIQATADAEAAEIAQATANAEATAAAEAEATAAFEATRAAYEAEKMEMVEEAQNETPIVKLEEGSLIHDDDGEHEAEPANVDLRNFVVQTRFAFEPGDTELDNGDFGLEFRSDDENVTCLLISQDGQWQLMNEEEGNSETIQDGEVTGLRDGWNEVVLYVDDEDGFFLLNGEFVDELDLKETAERGDIALATGLATESEVAGASTDYKDFSVWSLDPIPASPTPAASSNSSQTSTSTGSPEAPPAPAGVSAHTFPETPIRPFDRDEFISYLGRIRDSFRSFTSEMTLMIETGKYGDCGTFNGWVGLWILQAPGYTNVPAEYASLYVEYRSMLRQIVTITQEIRGLCSGEGGAVTDETLINIIEFLSWAYPRSEQMVTEASSLP